MREHEWHANPPTACSRGWRALATLCTSLFVVVAGKTLLPIALSGVQHCPRAAEPQLTLLVAVLVVIALATLPSPTAGAASNDARVGGAR